MRANEYESAADSYSFARTLTFPESGKVRPRGATWTTCTLARADRPSPEALACAEIPKARSKNGGGLNLEYEGRGKSLGVVVVSTFEAAARVTIRRPYVSRDRFSATSRVRTGILTTRELEGRPGRHRHTRMLLLRNRTRLQMEGDTGRLEGTLAEKTGSNDFTVLGVKSIPKCSVAFFFRQVAQVHQRNTKAEELSVVL